jgi:CPA2 family monovalent cation:H+ antiporter-2
MLLIMRVLWSPFVQLYTTAQVALRETFEEGQGGHDHEAAQRSLLPPAFAEARLRNLEIREGMPAAGTRIRDLRVRTLTGATIIGLERAGAAMVNPSPEEELRPGDTVLLLGNEIQIDASVALLEGQEPGG